MGPQAEAQELDKTAGKKARGNERFVDQSTDGAAQGI
jgi:hypothetical protein